VILISWNAAKQRPPENAHDTNGAILASDATGTPVSRRSSSSGSGYTNFRMLPMDGMGSNVGQSDLGNEVNS